MIRADASSLKEAANNVSQEKQQGKLQPEFQAKMDRIAGTLFTIVVKEKE